MFMSRGSRSRTIYVGTLDTFDNTSKKMSSMHKCLSFSTHRFGVGSGPSEPMMMKNPDVMAIKKSQIHKNRSTGGEQHINISTKLKSAEESRLSGQYCVHDGKH
jgi:hypothetical protein